MKKILMAAVALTGLTATPAMAQNTVASYSVTGNVFPLCSANSAGTMGWGTLVDGNGNILAPDQEVWDTSAFCNSAGTTMSIAHVDLTHDGATSAPAGFANVVLFEPVVTAGESPYVGDQSGTTVGAFLGLRVKASNVRTPSGLRPLAGAYYGSITVTLTPG